MEGSDVQRITDFNDEYAELVTEIAQNFFRKVQIEEQELALTDLSKRKLVEREELFAEMIGKYGVEFLELYEEAK